jgi:hypothetical protein
MNPIRRALLLGARTLLMPMPAQAAVPKPFDAKAIENIVRKVY